MDRHIDRALPHTTQRGRENLDVSGDRAGAVALGNGIWWIRAPRVTVLLTTYWYGNLGFRGCASIRIYTHFYQNPML